MVVILTPIVLMVVGIPGIPYMDPMGIGFFFGVTGITDP